MHRIDADAHVSNMFDPGDPLAPRLPTQVDPAWLNAVQEEIVNAILAAGITLVKGTNTQLAAAVVNTAAAQTIAGRKTFNGGIGIDQVSGILHTNGGTPTPLTSMLLIGAADFQGPPGLSASLGFQGDAIGNGAWLGNASGGSAYYVSACPRVPANSTITALQILVRCTSNATVNTRLERNDYAANPSYPDPWTKTTITNAAEFAAAHTGSTDPKWLTVTLTAGVTVTTDQALSLRVQVPAVGSAGAFALIGARLTYTSPKFREAV